MTTVDLNADLGESEQRWATGEDVALLDIITSANVCCGAYAGTLRLIRETCAADVARGVVIGAQVGYPDRAGFGRAPYETSSADLTDEIARQVSLLASIAHAVGGSVAYVKPHGALYNRIADDEVQAAAVVAAVSGLPLMGLPGSTSLRLAEAAGLPTIAEGFADRAYTASGRLVPRSEPGAVLSDPRDVGAQAVALLGSVESICVHSDSPDAVTLARAAREALEAAGATVQSTLR